MRNLSTAYILALFGFFGASGLHRFYLNKPVTGILWVLTGGLFFIGTIYDLITMEAQVDAFNRRAMTPAYVPPALPPAPLQWPSPPPAPALELQLLQLARHHGGRLTTPLAASSLGVSLTEAEGKLDELVVGGHAEIEANDDGVILYDFPSLRAA